MIIIRFRNKHLQRCYEDASYGAKELGKLFRKYVKNINKLKSLEKFNDLFTQMKSLRPHRVENDMISIDLDGNNRLWFTYDKNGELELIKIERIWNHGEK